ncbi:hypothetical protein EX30DRAFT_370923 [Ascodesmis nigricans]|uniref:Ecp2 effector protein domain-containing protein n=1 Tax=Ascodesmis nigricans TaxID=341454 RepID=A0A4S2MZK6_9PEZI|nr:hypothetical protein EX30DRAFT_370923 [Ascodesmis nigricans]
MKFSTTALFASLFLTFGASGELVPRQDAGADAAPPPPEPTPGVSIPPQSYPGVSCVTDSQSPLHSDCKTALSNIPRTDAPRACTKIYKPWHVVSTHGSCEIGYWSRSGNAHCQSNKVMIKYVERVLAKCRDGHRGSKVEGYEAVDVDGGRGVWVYGDK